MRRNAHNTCDTVRANFDKLSINEYNVTKIMDMLSDIKDDMRKFNFHMRMDTVDISDFFPLKSDADMKNFMDKSHEDWPMRRRGFHHLLFTTVTKSKKKFSTALLHTLFTRQFIANHKWPFSGYDIIIIIMFFFLKHTFLA